MNIIRVHWWGNSPYQCILTTVSMQKAFVSRSSAANLQPLWHKMQQKVLIQKCLSPKFKTICFKKMIQREHVQSCRKHWEPSYMCLCVCLWELLMVYCRWLMLLFTRRRKFSLRVWLSFGFRVLPALHLNRPEHIRRMHLHPKVSPSVITSAAGWQSSNQGHRDHH